MSHRSVKKLLVRECFHFASSLPTLLTEAAISHRSLYNISLILLHNLPNQIAKSLENAKTLLGTL